jgi:hypothetical protein
MNRLQRVQSRTQISRPLKVLIPLIKDELQEGDAAGHEHYRRAGEMLLEAREQLAHGAWGKWLKSNFELSRQTAYTYMQWAEHHLSGGAIQVPYASMREMTGHTERQRERRQAESKFREILREVAPETYAPKPKQVAREDETQLHRDLALELIELGYRALATKLHPDRGGSHAAMKRLNRVREVLKHTAETRRFEI